MSVIVIVGILILAILLLVVNLVYITLALYSLGISNIFRSLEEFLEGKNKPSEQAEEYLYFAGTISGFMLSIMVIVIILLIVVAVVGAPEEGIAAIGIGGAEVGTEVAGAEVAGAGGGFLGDAFGFAGRFVDDILIFVVIIIVLASIGSGVLCSLAANEIRNTKDYRDGKDGFRSAFNYSVIAAIAGFAVIGLVIIGTIALYVFRYWEKVEAEKKLQTEIRGFLVAKQIERKPIGGGVEKKQ